MSHPLPCNQSQGERQRTVCRLVRLENTITATRQAGFDATNKKLYLKHPPNVYDAMHEAFQAEQYAKLGLNKYHIRSNMYIL